MCSDLKRQNKRPSWSTPSHFGFLEAAASAVAALALGFFDGGIAALDPFDGAVFSGRFRFGSAPAAVVPCLAWETSYDGGCCCPVITRSGILD